MKIVLAIALSVGLAGCWGDAPQPRMVTGPVIYPLCVFGCVAQIQAADSEGSRVSGGTHTESRNVTGGAQSSSQTTGGK